MKVTKLDLVSNMTPSTSITRSAIIEVLDLFVEQLTCSLEQGNTIEYRGLGTFSVRRRKARRNARNPNVPGQTVEVQEHNVVFFRPGRRLRERVWHIKGEHNYA